MSCKLCVVATYTCVPFEVRTKSGNIVNAVFNYCPVCGRPLSKKAINDRKVESFDIVIEEMDKIAARLRGDF